MRHGPDDRVIFASAANEVASRLATDRGRAELGVIYGDVAWSASAGRGGGLQESSSRFLLYSFTKMIVAAAFLRLAVANGTLELDAPLATALSDTFGLPSMTLRQMLQHTSGLPDYGELQAYHDGVRQRRRTLERRGLPEADRREPTTVRPRSGLGLLEHRLHGAAGPAARPRSTTSRARRDP